MKSIFTLYDKPESGKLLLSEPFLKDAYFMRSVILLAEHNDEGSFGLIMNKPTEVKLNDVLDNFPVFDACVYFGGPVKTDSVFYLHSVGDLIHNSLKISDKLYFGGDIEQVKDMISGGFLTPSDIKFYAGYTGWSPKQLDKELEEKSWVIVDYKYLNFLENTPQNLWNKILRKMGSEYLYWSVSPIDPQLN